jgi:hypothetical protein
LSIDHGADINAQNKKEESALIKATGSSDKNLINLLIKS